MKSKFYVTIALAVLGVGYVLYTGKDCDAKCLLDIFNQADNIVDEIIEE